MAKSSVPPERDVSPAAIARQLDTIAISHCFRKAAQCMRLLRYITTLTLEGRTRELKEYSLGVSVLGRPDSYDPRIDPVVRLEARRLRLKLAEYYRSEGVDDDVIIELPKGAYVPSFRVRTEQPEPAPAPPPPRRWSPVAIGSVGLLILVAIGYDVYVRRQNIPSHPLIGVIGFQDLSTTGATSWVGSALVELLNIEFGGGNHLRAIPLENVSRMRAELSLQPQRSYTAGTLHQIRANLGTDYVVSGSYVDETRVVRLDLTLFDARSGRQVATIQERGTEDRLPDLTERCSTEIRKQLGIAAGSPVTEAPRVTSAALEPYARGMEYLRRSDSIHARKHLEEAESADPANPFIHESLAAAWSLLGLDESARREAKLAFDSATGLSRVEQLEIEGRFRSVSHEWPRAIEVYQALVTLFPEDLEYGLLLASAENQGGKARDTLELVSRLRKLQPPLGNDPRIDLAEAQAAGVLSDFAQTRRSSERAAEAAKARGARVLYARARLLQSGAMQNLAVSGFEKVRAEARAICSEYGDQACVAAAYRIEGNNHVSNGNLELARQSYTAALGIANQIGNSLEKLNALTGLAYAAQLEGDVKSAERMDREAMEVATEMGPSKSHTVSLDLGLVLADEGEIDKARLLVEESAQLARQFGDQEGEALSEAALGRLFDCDGRFADAIAKYQKALEMLRAIGEPESVRQVLLILGEAQLNAGHSVAAHKSFEEARELTQKFRVGPSAAEIEMAFARLNFEESKWSDAVPRAKAALAGFKAAGRTGDQYDAVAVLSRALLKQGHVEEASRVMEPFRTRDDASFPVRTRARFQLALCFVLASEGKRAEALRTIDSIEAHGLASIKEETRFARSELLGVIKKADSGSY